MSARWTGIAACSVTLASFACAPAGVDDAPSARASIDAVLRGAVERRKVAGMVAVAAFPSGVFYEGAFGKRDVGDGVDIRLDSMFRLASMTKAVTSVAAMQFVDEGELELDAPVSTYLPEFAPRVLEGFDAAPRGRVRRLGDSRYLRRDRLLRVREPDRRWARCRAGDNMTIKPLAGQVAVGSEA